ncbi:MAG: hypothetical protein OHK0022_49340 [Roseiflexaceae bacterium]
MIQLPIVTLSHEALLHLEEQQSIINRISEYHLQVEEAKRLFSLRNTMDNEHFNTIKSALTEMCCGPRRCVYCEDSCANEVEHIKPKTLYPEETFVWDNYLYACRICNGTKSDNFAVFSANTGEFINVARRKKDPIVRVEPGTPVLINPRIENPLDFIDLDLRGTFFFRPRIDIESTQHRRGEYTIETLELNRDPLPDAREEAYNCYKALLGDYIRISNNGSPDHALYRLIQALKRMRHPSVWREMKRKHTRIPDLNELFTAAPEALDW